MTSTLKAGLIALLTLTAVTGGASALDLKAGGQVKLKATSAQLGIISPAGNVCPGPAKLTAWVRTNKPGTVPILIVRKGGQVSGPYNVTTVKGANGVIMGSYSKPMNIVTPIDAEYRIVIPGSTVASNWVPLTADC
ncbi:MAG: hypothetical protein KKF33_00045 [Alphaproteobacteria bacterium]|nr:hypothetical protein [Alphaproteobacteria bacterium]